MFVVTTLWMFVTMDCILFPTHAHNYGYHGLNGDPTNWVPDPVDVTGAFTIEVKLRFDDLTDSDYRIAFQNLRTTDSGADDELSMHITSPKTAISMSVKLAGKYYTARSPEGTVILGETAVYSGGVDENGIVWIAKDGITLATQALVGMPLSVTRDVKLMGRNYYFDHHRLHGAVLGVKVTDWSNRSPIHEMEYMNIPGQIFDKPFTVSFWALFDDTSTRTGQKVFDFSTESGEDRIWFGQYSATQVEFGVCRETTCSTLIATPASLQDEWAFWHATLSPTGDMSIHFKDDVIASKSGVSLPRHVFRKNLFVGESLSLSDSLYQGVIVGLRVDKDVTS